MKKIMVNLFLCVIMFGCESNHELSVIIEPSSRGDLEYIITIKDCLIKIKINKLKLENGEFQLERVLDSSQKVLTEIQHIKFNNLIEDLRDESVYKFDNAVKVTDDWIFTIKIDNSISVMSHHYELYDKKEYEELKELINFVLHNSPVEINLQRFSYQKSSHEPIKNKKALEP